MELVKIMSEENGCTDKNRVCVSSRRHLPHGAYNVTVKHDIHVSQRIFYYDAKILSVKLTQKPAGTITASVTFGLRAAVSSGSEFFARSHVF